ncbi:hypothetical protein [Jeotgalibaca sp. A122]|uniref:hypothetical protein n=1 Tax=Jeotgalibaca sp. A122 TaxID=3457322 RepID=UPI003FD23E7E
MKTDRKSDKGKNVLLTIVLFFLIASTFYAIYMFFQAPSGSSEHEGVRMKSDYVVMALQSIIGGVMIFLPIKLQDKFDIYIPNIIEIIYIIFLFAAIYLGEIQNFYYIFPFWDTLLHFLSAGMLGATGFLLVNLLTGIEKLNLRLSPSFVSFFAFCFAVMVGAIWEIIEFLGDGIMDGNMQKYKTYEGTVLLGRVALKDTMQDLIVDSLGSLFIVLLGYFYLKRKSKSKSNLT